MNEEELLDRLQDSYHREQELADEVMRLRAQIQHECCFAADHPLTIPEVADAAEHISQQLAAGQLDPTAARTALYALQVALSALRTKEESEARKQKEERLRSPKPQPTPATPENSRSHQSQTNRSSKPKKSSA